MKTHELPASDIAELFKVLSARFEKNMLRHQGMQWSHVQARLEAQANRLWSLYEMEKTGGEPDVVAFDAATREYTFYDCASETPKGRRSLCYDQAALDSRKAYKPVHSAVGMAEDMGITLLNEQQYFELQALGAFDLKTSSWLLTPPAQRKLGGAIFGDRRFDRVFIYHNGVESYYGARAFRGWVTY